DDGLDADVEELEGLLARYQEGLRGMGLSNVNDRIRLCYGEGYGIQFERREPKGLIVRVIQPLVAGGGQKEGGQYD
ncbi:MAG: sensor histidine kinase, partial [Hungatella hathewayi]